MQRETFCEANTTYDNLYTKLEPKKGRRGFINLAKVMEMETVDFDDNRCIKDDVRVLVKKGSLIDGNCILKTFLGFC